MAHILPSSELLAWCEHGCPLGHTCWDCRRTTPAPTPPVPVGWTCPSCRHSYAPWVPECRHCPQQPAAKVPVTQIQLHPVMSAPGAQHMFRADGEWREAFQGLQVLLAQPAGDGEALLHFRLTPEGTASDPSEH